MRLVFRAAAPTALNVSVAPVMVICVIRPNSEPFVYTCSENNNAIVDKSHSDVMAASSYLKSSPFQVCITTLVVEASKSAFSENYHTANPLLTTHDSHLHQELFFFLL